MKIPSKYFAYHISENGGWYRTLGNGRLRWGNPRVMAALVAYLGKWK